MRNFLKVLEFLLQILLGIILVAIVVKFSVRAYIEEADLRNKRHEVFIQLQIDNDNKKDL